MAFLEVHSSPRFSSDGLRQNVAYRTFEADLPSSGWESEVGLSLPDKGTAHPHFADLVCEQHTVESLAGDNRTRVTVAYSNYGAFSQGGFFYRKTDQPVQWTLTYRDVEDVVLANLKVDKTLAVPGGEDIVGVWTVVELEPEVITRNVQKATAIIPHLTRAWVDFIGKQNGKLHYFGSGSDPGFTSGEWYRFEAPIGLESSKTEQTITYSWLHDPGVGRIPIPVGAETYDIPWFSAGGKQWTRLPWHRQLSVPATDPRVDPATFKQFRRLEIGTVEGSSDVGGAWKVLPGMVLPP